ncbi:MAG TPA: hypothetical protein VFS23_25340 [Vicinamibacterales bacterium]|nr:hypothetical protein [Vicinamibacterales bacterium]
MQRTPHTLAVVVVTSLLAITSEISGQASTDANVLATVRITTAVLADGAPLPPGTYDVRLTQQRPTPFPGQSWEARQWVEFVANGKVVAREAAEVLRDDDLPAVGASSAPARSGTRVEMLKGGEFLRVSVKRDHERYLIHLPVMR